MKDSVFFLIIALFLCTLDKAYSQIHAELNGADTSLYEYGEPIIKSEDNIKNLFQNFPLYVENGEDLDLLSYDYVGTIKHKRDAKKFIKRNFDENISLGWSTVFYKNKDEINKSIPSSANFFIEHPLSIIGKEAVKNIINTISEEYIHIGDEVFVINFIVDLQKRRHYVFINPETKKILLNGNIFGFEFPMTHIESINANSDILQNVRDTWQE